MIHITFFARYRELIGKTELDIEFTGTVRDLLDRTELTPIPPNALIAINHKIASGSDIIESGSRVSFFPPVSGG
ncbi:MAG: MoaD/ThiS family protein [Holophagaceae bacterium]